MFFSGHSIGLFECPHYFRSFSVSLVTPLYTSPQCRSASLGRQYEYVVAVHHASHSTLCAMKARIRRLSVSVDSPFAPNDHQDDNNSLATSTTSSQSSGSTLKDTSRIERMRKLLSSPLSSRRKSATNPVTSNSNGSNSTGSCSGSPQHSNNKTNGYTNAKYKIFGAPLSTHSGIPFVVTRLCSYIESESGLQQEGLFRISGNVKLIEKLKNSFDSCGDAPLEEVADVPSAAALVKLFLRELPEPVIPANMHQILFQAAKDYSNSDYYLQQQQKLKQLKQQQQQQQQQQQKFTEQGDSCDGDKSNCSNEASLVATGPPNDITGDTDAAQDEESIRQKERHCTYVQRIRSLVSILPSANFYTLRYLCCFLNRVSQYESSNRMNAASLGIVFGPTVFRISTQEYTTLRDEAIDGPNQVVTALITECHVIFDPVPDPSFSTSSTTVVLLDPRKSVILSGSSTIPGTSKTKKGASIDLCELRQSSLHQSKRNFSQDEDDCKASAFSLSGKKTLNKKKATIVPIVVLSHTDDDTDLSSATNVTAMSNILSDKVTSSQQNNRRKRSLSSNSGNLIRSVSEERASTPLEGSFDSITNELRRCASSDSLIKSKRDSTTLAAVVAATTASLLFPSCASLVPPSVVQPSTSLSSSSSSPSSHSPSSISSSESEQNNNSGNSGNTATSIATVVHDDCNSGSSQDHPSNNDNDNDGDDEEEDGDDAPHPPDGIEVVSKCIDTKSSVTDDKGVSEDSNIRTSIELANESMKTRDEKIESRNPPDSSYVTTSVLSKSVQFKNGNTFNMIDGSNDDTTQLKDTRSLGINCKDKVNVEVTVDDNNDDDDDENVVCDDNNNTADGNLNVTGTINFHNVPTVHRNSWSGNASKPVSVVVSTAFLDEITTSKMDDSSTSPSSLAALRHSASSIVEPEAPVSPSAYRSYLTRRASEHLLSVAPSPPLEQDNYSGHSKINILQSAAVKSVKRQIGSLKKQIKEYEVDFEAKHGYPPSMDQKMNSTLARPVLLELNKLKKSLKDFKQGAVNEGDDFSDERYLKESDFNEFLPSLSTLDCEEHFGTGINVMKKCTFKKRTSNGEYLNVPCKADSKKCSCNCNGSESDVNTLRKLEEQLHKLQEAMTIKRFTCNRPEDVTLMTAGQIMDEKTDLQRELLKFESIYGHPDCERHRHIMRPIYDRYRSIKRLVAGMPTVNTITVELSNTSPALETSASVCSTSSEIPLGKSILNSTCKVHKCVTSLDEDDCCLEQMSTMATASTTDASEILEPIPENVAIEFKQTSITCSNPSSTSNSCSSTSSSKSNSGPPNNGLVTTTTSATIVAISPSDLARIKKQQGAPITSKSVVTSSQKKHSFSLPGENSESIVGGSNSDIIQYHEMSLMQLMEQLNRSRSEKKHLQRIIRSLEEDMRQKLGRKIEKEDRIQPVYTTYKQVKGKLRLLKALVAKSEKGQHPSRMSL